MRLTSPESAHICMPWYSDTSSCVDSAGEVAAPLHTLRMKMSGLYSLSRSPFTCRVISLIF